jgi:predicted metal-binding membrane protein
MESARLPLRAPLERSRLGLIGLLLGLAVVAWLLTDSRMQGMDAGPGTDLGGLGFYVSAWVVMMAAMMFPSIMPMVTVYAGLQDRRRQAGKSAPSGAIALFVAGYLLVWTAAGLIAFALFELGQAASVDALSWERGGPYLAGGVILAAAVYQLTPLKDACLTRCRGPLSFVIENWSDGRAGALRMGILHGGWCVGCCWALMAVLFALGVMSIGWMIFVAALIAIEKLLPWKALANHGIAACLVVLGLAVAFVPAEVPGLVLPDSSTAMRAMKSMEAAPGAAKQMDSGMESGSGDRMPGE